MSIQKQVETVIVSCFGEQPFWKQVLFGVVCLERQWVVYKRLAFGRDWDAVVELQGVMDAFWQWGLSGSEVSEDCLYMAESNLPEITEDWDSIAWACVESIAHMVELLREEHGKLAEIMSQGNFDFLYQYAELEEVDADLMDEREAACQLDWLNRILVAEDKGACVQWCREHCGESILGDCWFSGYPEYEKLPAKGETVKEVQTEIGDYLLSYGKYSVIEQDDNNLRKMIKDWKEGRRNRYWPKVRTDGHIADFTGSTEYFDFYEGFAEYDADKLAAAFAERVKVMRSEVRSDYQTLLDLNGIAYAKMAKMRGLPLMINIAEIPAELHEELSVLTDQPILPGSETVGELFQLKE